MKKFKIISHKTLNWLTKKALLINKYNQKVTLNSMKALFKKWKVWFKTNRRISLVSQWYYLTQKIRTKQRKIITFKMKVHIGHQLHKMLQIVDYLLYKQQFLLIEIWHLTIKINQSLEAKWIHKRIICSH